MADIRDQSLAARLRGYAKDESGWHCIDDTCEAAATRIEELEDGLREILALPEWERMGRAHNVAKATLKDSEAGNGE